MDYPLLRFLSGLGLALAESTSVGIAVLLRKAPWPRRVLIAGLIILILSLLAGLVAFVLLFRVILPADIPRLALGIVVIAAIFAVLTFLLDRAGFPAGDHAPTIFIVLALYYVLAILVSLFLAYSIFRNIVPL
jgi:hypothetical protein